MEELISKRTNLKIKILFVVSEFWNAGCQRYTYEVHKNINRNKFKISILSLRDLNSNENWEDHFYKLHSNLNNEIYFYNKLKNESNLTFIEKIKLKITRKIITNSINDFVDKFDFISVMGEYNFNLFSKNLTIENKKKCFIHLHNSILQHPTNYINYDFNEKYRFISSFKEEEINFELKDFKNYEHFYMPLAITLPPKTLKWNIEHLQRKKIGIFTRLTKTKPIEPFIYSLQLLKNHFPNIELHIFGTGCPEELGLINHINYLNLSKSVFFRGHVKDIIETTLKEQLSIVWFQGYHGVPAGHSGFDMCSIAIPQVFWNFGSVHEGELDSRFPMFKDLSEFVNYNIQLFENKKLASKLGNDQFNYINEERNMKIEVKKLEKIYTDFFEKNN